MFRNSKSYTWSDGSFLLISGHLADGSILPEGDYYIKMYDPANTENHWTSQFFTISTTCDIPVNCSIPSAATASNITSSNALISWTASSPDPNFVSYYLEMSYNGSQWYVINDNYTGTTYDFNANSRFLSPCRDYYVRVRSNCSDMSQTDPNTATQVQFTTDGTDCAAIRAGIVGECTSPDEDDPIFINCPAGYVFGNDPDQCGAFVNWSIPIANDNCPGVLVSHFSRPNYRDFLDVGDYIVNISRLDTAGNVSYCSFPVSVQDTQNPFISVHRI
ncbi:MAG: HYR domain-containing protein [Saprospiraceae bacterium]|nr:HYR domain-containing protein [Saprospiraceae bacterium]